MTAKLRLSYTDARTGATKTLDFEGDEARLIHRIASRVVRGREVYGQLELVGDHRDFGQERLEELLDAVVYGAAMSLRRPEPPAPPEPLVTERQLNAIMAIGRSMGWCSEAIRAYAVETHGVPTNQLTRRDASDLIDRLQRRALLAAQPAQPAPAKPSK